MARLERRVIDTIVAIGMLISMVGILLIVVYAAPKEAEPRDHRQSIPGSSLRRAGEV